MVLRKRLRKKKGEFNRLNFLTIVIFLFCGLIIYRLFNLQIIQHSFYEALASGQHVLYQKLFPERGEIFVRDKDNSEELYPLAVNIDLSLVYAIPTRIKEPEEVAKKLSPLLQIPEEELLTRLSKEDDMYEPLKHELSDEEVEEVKALELEGIDFTPEGHRLYPEGDITGQVLGFVGYVGDERKGQYGVEGYFDEELTGQQGFLKAEQDASGHWITVGEKLLEEAQDGEDFILTLDPTIQFTVCDKLKESVRKHGADEGSAIVTNPKTGAILAMCNYPNFDPNQYSQVDNINVFLNSAIFDQYEPGSVFKPIGMAAALELGKVSPTTTYVDEGQVQIGSYTIRNSDEKAHGVQTMTNVLEMSLNTGAIYATGLVGNEMFYHYVQKFGFGEKTGIELDTENPGDISPLAIGKDIYRATASYGQGITVTPLQLIMAFGAIANEGKLMKPYIVDERIKSNDYRQKTEPQVIRQVISPATARTLSAMLVSVIEKGHAYRAGVEGYYLAGKTGTAQVPRKDVPGYQSGVHIDSFVGYGPVSDPKFIILTKMNNPRDVQWAEGSVAPLVGEIAEFLLNYYQIPPDVVEE